MAPAPSSAGRSAVVGTFEFATEDGQDGSDGLSTVLGRPISDIVKRVVTVKQVQPFRLAGPGHGYAKTPGQVVPAERRLMPWFQGAGHRAQKVESEADGQSPVCSRISVV